MVRRSLIGAAIAIAIASLIGVPLGAAIRKSQQATRDELQSRLHETRRRFAALAVPSREPATANESVTTARQVTLGTLAQFLPYVQDDLHHGLVERATRQLQSLEWMLDRVEHANNSGPEAMVVHPNHIGSSSHQRIFRVVGSAIVAAGTTGDGNGAVDRPVFLTGYGVYQRVRDDVERLPAVGANLIQIEIGPKEVFPKPGVVDHAPLKALLNVLDRAARAGVAVDVLLSPHYFPDWMLDSVPELRRRREGFVQFCTHHPAARDFLRRYVHTVVAEIRDHPALLSVCLVNEARNEEEPCKFAEERWRLWLQRHHEGLENFNRAHHSNVHSFEMVPLPNPFAPPSDRAIWADYLRFNQDQLADWIETLATAVHENAPNLPVHAKVAAPLFFGRQFRPTVGVDPTLLAKLGQLNGNDDINLFQYGRSDFAESWQPNAMACDLQKSLNPAPVFNSENHVIPDRESRSVPPEHLHAALWQAAVHGQAATSIWMWDRSFDRKHDFWGSILERPDAVREVGLTNLDLNRAAKELRALQDAPWDVSILSSTSALAWDDHVPAITEALYTALAFTGVKIGFFTERQLEDGINPQTSVAFIPGNIHISRRAMVALERYSGRIVFVGGKQLLSRDDHDQLAPTTLSAELLETNGPANSWRALWRRLRPALAHWNVLPSVQLKGANGEPIWGIEWRSACGATGACLVNLCNYRHDPVTIRLTRAGRIASGKDVLSNACLPESIELTSLQTRLVQLD